MKETTSKSRGVNRIPPSRCVVYLFVLLGISLLFTKQLFKILPTPPKTLAQAPPPVYNEIEEMTGWRPVCYFYTDPPASGQPKPSCPAGHNFVSYDTRDKISGAKSLVLTGQRDKQEIYYFNLSVKPATLYKLKAHLKIKDRVVFSYLEIKPPNYSYPYPTEKTQQRPGVLDTVERTKGIWSGNYSMSVNNANLLPPIDKGAPYRSPQNLDWFLEEDYFRTTENQTTAKIQIQLEGFEGKLYVDGITVEEAGSFIDDKYFHLPLSYEFQGMKISNVSRNPLFVETNVAKFEFGHRSITMKKSGTYVGKITLPNNFLNGLSVTQETGNVFLENNNLKLSIGADSTILVKFKTYATLSVRGPRPTYHDFEAGIIFATDYTKGLLFAPLRTKDEIASMPCETNRNTIIVTCKTNASDYPDLGLNWVLEAGFGGNWQVDYSFSAGRGFIAQVFPPKDFENRKFCQERMHTLGSDLDLVNSPQADFSYNLQKFGERANIGLIWFDNYAIAPNNLNPPTEYCQDEAKLFVACDSPGVKYRIPVGVKADVTGPFFIANPIEFKNFIQTAHQKGMKIIIYMSPAFYYTAEVDRFLANLKEIIDNFGIDGVYFDTLYFADPLKSLEVARKTRNLLGDKFYTLHNSWTMGLIKRSHRFRIPFEDAYADLVWNGENIKLADDETFNFNYCGYNVSNTASTLLGELRPVDYSLGAEGSAALSLSPRIQADKMLACRGMLRGNPYSPNYFIRDKTFGTVMTDDANYLFGRYDSYCQQYTCGNSICDIGENIYSCPGDCAPQSNEAILYQSGNHYSCQTNYPLAQWKIGSEGFYRLHFTFEGELAKDESDNKMSPFQNLGVIYPKPQLVNIDNVRAVSFDGTNFIHGQHDRTLDLTDKNFSSFAKIKRGNSENGLQVVFALNNDKHFYYGLRNSKLYVSVAENNNDNEPDNGPQKTYFGTTVIDQNWHTVGIVYERPKLKLYVDGQKETEVDISLDKFKDVGQYMIGALSSAKFVGYIDDLFVTDRALTDIQAQQYHNTLHKQLTVVGSNNIRCVVLKDGKYLTAALAPTPTPIPGDFNRDGQVDILDLRHVLSNFTNIFDYNLVVGNFGNGQ